MKRRKRRIMAILLAFAMIFTMVDPSIFGGAITVQAEEVNTDGNSYKETGNGWSTDGNTYYIQDVSNLEYVVEHYDDVDDVGPQLRKARFVVTDNINLGTSAANRINIGTKDYPFTREFDGQGYTISGLKCDEEIATNGGLFGIMSDGAIIKDLIIDNASIRSNHYGGILAAQAKDAIIQNVTIKNSKCKIASFGAVIGLITTGGLYGGALVGYANNTKIYNCESRNTVVEVDTVGGVQALGGDGMYMGGLVGWMDNGSIIEYSRVIGGTEGKVETKYEIAVGALAANNLYAGGIVGRLDGNGSALTQILDCFSDTYVNFHGANYVSVGSGISGYAGGIAARVSGSNYEMERCHYAGKLSSYLLNSVLVLPVIPMEDYYLGGIAGNVEDSSKIHNCYFNWEKAIQDNTRKKVPAIYSESNRGDVTTIGDAQYSNSTFFVGFDFDGTDEANLRNTNNNELLGGAHYNKWVINRDTNMPVHGNIVYAETDFPGAGTISFAATSIQEEKKTDGWTKEEKPDDELANGISISQIAQTYSDMNEEVILTATVNEGYNFEGWYLRRDGVETAIPTTQYGSQKEGYKLVLGGDSTSKYEYEDGDIFIAKYTADIVFENLDGTSFKIEQYTYNQIVNTSSKVPSATGYIFLGWSIEKLPDNLNSEKLDSTTISQITTWAEDNITVTKAMHLYPVFIQVTKYNVGVQMQSASQKEGEATYIKKATGNEGTAKICTDENGDIYITVEHVDENGDSIEGINEENGYRFSGWYEVSEDETSGKLVSRNKEYYLTNVDLTQRHQYEARYQYRVRTRIPVRPTAGYLKYIADIPSASYFGDFYVDYNVSINDNGVIPKPGFNEDEIKLVYWTNDVKENWKKGNNIEWGSSLTHIGGMEAKAYEFKFQEGEPVINVTEPKEVYGIVTWTGSLGGSYRPVIAQTDFPSATTKIEITNAKDGNNGFIEAILELQDGYKLKGFRAYTSNDYGESWENKQTASDTELSSVKDGEPWHVNFGYSTSFNTVLMAQITANINMYSLDDNDKLDNTILERKYNSLLFNVDSEGKVVGTKDDTTDTTLYDATPYYTMPDDCPVGDGDTKTDEEMYRPNYQFVGWITLTDESAMDLFGTTNLEEIAAKKFVTENRASVDGYLLYQPGKENTFKVTEAINICPVYVSYKATFKTNFAGSTANGVPMLSEEECIPTNDGVVTITLPTVNGYNFQKWEIISEDGVNPGFEDNGKGKYTFTIKPETEYTITAVYEATVSFKDAMKDSNGTVSDKEENYLYNQPISDKMDKLPISYATVNTEVDKIDMQGSGFKEDTYVFVGWKDYAYNSSGTAIKEPTLPSDYTFVSENTPVIGATDMIPVYTKPQITLDSNIGAKSEATINISKEGTVTLEAPEQDGYVFTGWVEKIGDKENVISTESSYIVSPEELRKEHTYIASYEVVITYKIPVVDETTNELTGSYTEMKSSIPLGQAIIDPDGEYNNYNVGAFVAVITVLEKTEYTFEGNWYLENEEADEEKEYDYELAVTEPIVLKPILKKGLKITVYSNLDDKEYIAKMTKNGDNLAFPIENNLTIPTDTVDKGINGENVTPQFVGYSLVDIKGEKRTSAGLYAAGQEISSETLSEYNGADSNKRIYAVWAQIQTIPKEIMYFGGGTPEFSSGLLTMSAVNTSILERAGIKGYTRYFSYINPSAGKKVESNCGSAIWDDELYISYFHDNAPDGWNVYGSVLFDIPEVLYNVSLEFRSYIIFDYENSKDGCILYGDTEENLNECVVEEVALEMLKNLNDYSNLNLSTANKDKLAQYAGYNDFSDYENNSSN